MANYYLMNEIAWTAYENRKTQIRNKYKDEEAEIQTKIREKCEKKNLDSIYYYAYCESAMKPIDEAKKAEMNDFLEMLYMVEGTKKAEVCAKACRLCEEIGVTQANIIRPVYNKEMHQHVVDQSWFVYKEDGVWYQKMSEDCVAKHEVLL